MAGHVDEPLVFPILWILNALIQHGADGHNTIFQPGQLRESADPSERHVRVEVISDGIGYLDVPGNGNSLESLDEYATQLQDAVNSVKQPSCGWIIDLRNNEGGNLFAMLSGLAGVHRGATVEFMDATGAITRATAYADGSAQIETPLFGTLTRLYGTPQDPFTNGDDMLPIAVLVGPQTASAAEALALALINRGNVRLFGQVTSGDTSAPMAITLSDAHAVSISAAWFLDEHRNIVSTGIAPDEIVSEGNVSQGSELSSSPASNRAVEWLTSTFECAP
jgi:C-terminal processing protease CtpA/Prc